MKQVKKKKKTTDTIMPRLDEEIFFRHLQACPPGNHSKHAK